MAIDSVIGKRTNTNRSFESIIMYPGSPGTGVGSGVGTIVAQVGAGDYTWDDVRQYDYATLSFLQQMPWKSWADLATFKTNAPDVKVYALCRPDLWWIYNASDPAAALTNAAEAWGTLTDKPTAAMGMSPESGQSWATTQTALGVAGYSQQSDNATATNSGALLTSPYNVTLDPGGSIWHCRSNQMDTENTDWQDLWTDYAVAIATLHSDLDGFIIMPEKIQKYDDGFNDNFAFWMDGTENIGWDLATNTGGTEGAWATNGEAYDMRTGKAYGCVNGSFEMATKLKAKTTLDVIYSVEFQTISTWRHFLHRASYQSGYIDNNPGHNNTDADRDWVQKISDLSRIVDGMIIPNDIDLTWDFTGEFTKYMRNSTKIFIITPPSPQDVSLTPPG